MTNAKVTMAEKTESLFELAKKGNLKAFREAYVDNPHKLSETDAIGRTPIHYLASNGHVELMEFALCCKADINAQDSMGNSPLHLAVIAKQNSTIKLLLKREADVSILNKQIESALHMAADQNCPDIIEIILSKSDADPDIRGEHGATPLHYATRKDYADCAKKLLDHSAHICRPDDRGLYPAHIAAQTGAKATLKMFMSRTEIAGVHRLQMLQFTSQEKSTPLHTAVNGGDIEIVQICLEAGATIDTLQEDQSTPVHLACSQGSLDMVKLMFSMQPEKKAKCLSAINADGMTILHVSVNFGRVDVVNYLLTENVDRDAQDANGQTPLLLAAAKSAWSCLEAMFTAKADVHIRDNKQKNVLHLMIQNGGRLDDVNMCVCTTMVEQLLNEPDINGCTPLHYTSREGHITTIDSLLKLGASLLVKDLSQQSPLHFAARYGRYNTCRRLLDGCGVHNVINERDDVGLTPTHAAALNGHFKVVDMFLHNGASMSKDLDGNTPLHLAASNGYTRTMAVILRAHPHLLNSVNKRRNTPLHSAAIAGHSSAVVLLMTMNADFTLNANEMSFIDEAITASNNEVCIAAVMHNRWRAMMTVMSPTYGCPIVGFIKFMPEVCQMVVDRCCTTSDHPATSAEYHEIYDFTFLQAPVSMLKDLRESGREPLPLCTSNLMVKYNRVECLSHPVSTAFLMCKWYTYGVFVHWINLLIYVLFMVSLTAFVTSFDFRPMPLPPEAMANDTDGVTTTATSGLLQEKPSTTQVIVLYLVLVFSMLNIVKEIAQMVQQYFLELGNAIEWILYVTSAVMAAHFFGAPIDRGQAVQCGAIAVFLAWNNFLLFLERFDTIGIYVVMFQQILKTMVQTLFVFFILIVGFAIAFYMLLCENSERHEFETPALSIVSTIVMMLGNIEYVDNWVIPLAEKTMSYKITFGLLIVFILYMPIIVINLLIGLAVGDIGKIRRDAKLKRIAMQVALYTDLERKVPLKLLDYLLKDTWKVYPNRACNMLRTTLCHSVISTDVSLEGDAYNPELDHQAGIYEELNKQRNRLKQISSDLRKQTNLLSLIMQKMEIKTDADDMDDMTCSTVTSTTEKTKGMGWSSPVVRQTMLKQANALARWRGTSDDTSSGRHS